MLHTPHIHTCQSTPSTLGPARTKNAREKRNAEYIEHTSSSEVALHALRTDPAFEKRRSEDPFFRVAHVDTLRLIFPRELKVDLRSATAAIAFQWLDASFRVKRMDIISDGRRWSTVSAWNALHIPGDH
jgi:hypothetical protein